MGTGTSRRSISSLELTYSCIYVYISVYFYLELMEGQRNRAARVLANPFRQRALGRVAELGDTFLMVMPSVKYRSTALRRSSIENMRTPIRTPKRPTFRPPITMFGRPRWSGPTKHGNGLLHTAMQQPPFTIDEQCRHIHRQMRNLLSHSALISKYYGVSAFVRVDQSLGTITTLPSATSLRCLP